MYPVCPPDCLLGLRLVCHSQCGGEVCISLISLLVPFLHFTIVQETTIVLNLQIHNGRRDTHTMAQEFQQSHLCGIVELLGSVRLSVSCLSVPRIKLRRLIVKIEHNQLQKQASTYLLGPLINSPPAHPDTVLTLVVYMMKSLQELGMTYSQLSKWNEMKWWCFRPLLCTLVRLNWAKQTPGIMRWN